MQQLHELLRLRKAGARFDYYLMDAFWYARDGAYRTWRKPHWPNGPDAWLNACAENDIKPGLWVAGNTTHSHDPVAAWQDSLTADGHALCLFKGGFLPHFLESLHLWYERGVRLYKFDFMNLGAATPELEYGMLPSEIRAANITVLQAGLKAFRQQHPDIVFIAYNGFEEHPPTAHGLYGTQNNTSQPFRKTVDTKWLEVFDSLYCGDPRPADVPAMNFWRAKDIYSDHMVRIYEMNGLPLQRIDNSGFMIGTTGTCYYRKTAAWQGMLLLSLARGGWVNTYYGNLDLLSDEQAVWFARVQALYLKLQQYGRFQTFGALPGTAQPYGFAAEDASGGLYAVVNPSQSVQRVALPTTNAHADVLFCDSGYTPTITKGQVTLGPEQLVLVGTGEFAKSQSPLSQQMDVVIPQAIEEWPCQFETGETNTIHVTVKSPARGCLRIVMQQFEPQTSIARRITGGAPPAGITLGHLLQISAEQGGQPVPVTIQYDKAIWSGLSWAVGEIDAQHVRLGEPLTIICRSHDKSTVQLQGRLYAVQY
jgi:hypothetical protein